MGVFMWIIIIIIMSLKSVSASEDVIGDLKFGFASQFATQFWPIANQNVKLIRNVANQRILKTLSKNVKKTYIHEELTE